MTITVILEGGLVRDVVGVDHYEVLDLDTEGADLELLEEMLEQAQELPADYPDRISIIKDLQEEIKLFAEWGKA